MGMLPQVLCSKPTLNLPGPCLCGFSRRNPGDKSGWVKDLRDTLASKEEEEEEEFTFEFISLPGSRIVLRCIATGLD